MKRAWPLALTGLLLLAGCPRGTKTPPPATSASAPVHFEDEAAARGLVYRWPDEPKPLTILDAMGRGCAFLDYDGDGFLDVLLVDGQHPLLFHNEPGPNGRTFRDVTSAVGLDRAHGAWYGCAVADVDGDGRLDILLTGHQCLALLRNEPSGASAHFRDITRAAGLPPDNGGRWGLSAGFMDLDGSGRLALVVANYVRYGPGDPPYCELRAGVKSGCPVNHYVTQYPALWRNVSASPGKVRFEIDVAQSGFAGAHGRAMSLAFADVDGSGGMDIYIGNDGYEADLFGNLLGRGGLGRGGRPHFVNVGAASGAAYGLMSHPIAAMGADFGDYDRDGHMDLALSAFSDEPYSLLHNTGSGQFEYVSDLTGISGPTQHMLGFGVKWVDFDNDGWLDLAFANGHVYDNAEQINPLDSYREPMLFFHSLDAGGRRIFQDLADRQPAAVRRPIVGRGVASGDFDNDGLVDLLVVDYEGAPLLLHNLSGAHGHWITLDLRGRAPNTFAYGAQVTVRSGAEKWVGQVSPGSSYLSSSDPRVHFGLGATAKIDAVEIRWSDGKRQTVANPPVDQIVRIDEVGR